MTGYQSKRAMAQEPIPNRLERLLWEYIDLQAAHPEHKPNHKTWSYLKIYAPLPEQEPVAWLEPEWGEKICPEVGYEVTMTDDHPKDLGWIPLAAQPEQERNFCPRCGKRTADLTTIHTCTPPQENT